MRFISPFAVAALLPLAIATACDGTENDVKGGGADTAAAQGDTGDTGPDYEDGCILVDGGGGYAWINDAIAVASEGSTIELCAAALHEEAVVVDKGVSIVGPGTDNLILSAPINENAVTITASNASFSGVSIHTTRSGVVVSAGAGAADLTGITISDIQVVAAPNWGISIDNATGVVLDSVLMVGNGSEGSQYGGVSIDDAEVTAQDSLFQNNIGYGIFATNGAVVHVSGSEFTATQPSDIDSITDGHGFYGTEGSRLSTDSNFFNGNVFINVYADSADLSMSGDDIVGGLYGVAAIAGTTDISDITVDDAYFHGIIAVSPLPVTFTGLVVTGAADTTIDVPDDTWNVDDGSGNADQRGTAIYVASDDILISDSTFAGYNNGGAMVLPYESGTATLSRVTFADNGRHGLYTAALQVTLEDVSITGLIEKEAQDPADACLTVDRYAGAVFVENTVQWVGGTLSENQGFGAVGIRAAMSMSGIDVGANGCAGIMNFGGSLVATANTFSKSIPRSISNEWIESSIVDYQSGGATISGNTFFDNQRERVREGEVVDTGSYTYQYIYYDHGGSDIIILESGPSEVTSNTFTDGVGGMQAYSTELQISDNTWTNYYNTAVYTTGDVSVDVSDNTFDNVSSAGVYCSSGRVSLEGNEFTGGSAYLYSVERYTDGALDYSYDSTYIGQAVSLSGCSMSMDGDTIEDYAASAIYSYSSSTSGTVDIELVDVVIDSVNTNEDYDYNAAILAYAYYGGTDILLDGVEITNSGGDHALEIYNDFSADYYEGTASLTVLDSTIEAIGDNGLMLQGDGITASIDGTVITSTGGPGIELMYGANITLSDSFVTGSGETGIVLTDSTLTLDTSAPSQSTLSTSYGLSCDATSEVVDCGSLDLSGNTLGEHTGCDAWCLED